MVESFAKKDADNSFDADKDGDYDEVQEPDETALKVVHANKSSPAFSRDLQLEAVIGVVIKRDQLFYLIKWRGVDEPELVSKKDAHQKWPLKVLKFHEDLLEFDYQDINGIKT